MDCRQIRHGRDDRRAPRYRVGMRGLLFAACLVACSGADNSPPLVAPVDSGASVEPDATAPEDASSPMDGGRDAGRDAACVPPPASTHPPSDECTPIAMACSCGEGRRYRCTATGAIGQPQVMQHVAEDRRLAGCRVERVLNDIGESDYCCQPACVRTKSSDAACGPVRNKAWTCATKPDGNSVVGEPKPSGCSYLGNPDPGSPTIRFCCE